MKLVIVISLNSNVRKTLTVNGGSKNEELCPKNAKRTVFIIT